MAKRKKQPYNGGGRELTLEEKSDWIIKVKEVKCTMMTGGGARRATTPPFKVQYKKLKAIAVLARYKEKAGWAQKKTRQTPLLNDAHKDARIEYCVRNEGEDFRRRAMIDEKIFEDTPPRQ